MFINIMPSYKSQEYRAYFSYKSQEYSSIYGLFIKINIQF